MAHKSSRIRIAVQYRSSRRGVPHASSLRAWALSVLSDFNRGAQLNDVELTLRIVGSAESRALNRHWRGKDKPTNVLSFPFSAGPAGTRLPSSRLLGDLVLCAPVIAREAREQGKTPQGHWAHMVIHGALHLLGHDHVKDRDAKRMEALEVDILARLGIKDPYVSAV